MSTGTRPRNLEPNDLEAADGPYFSCGENGEGEMAKQ